MTQTRSRDAEVSVQLLPPFDRCREAADVYAACEGLADDLLDAGFDLPSVYLMTGDRLRCRAARGYFQVVDGFRAGTGIIGQVVESGREQLIADVTRQPEFIAAIPGLRSEACVPVVSSEGVIGAVNIESRSALDESAMPVLRQAAQVLAQRLDELGGMPAPSQAHVLGQVAVAMTQAASTADIERLCVQAAVELSGVRTAAVIELTGRRPVVTTVRGPLAESLRSWDADELATMADWVSAGTSSHFPGGESPPADYAFLAAAHVRALSVHPLVVTGKLSGLLVLASSDPVAFSTSVVEMLEILAAQTAASLGVASAMAELARRVDLDGLTGLRNAAAFTADLDEVPRDGSGALVLIDVDHFKTVNDSFGHLAGDRLLNALAAELTNALRDGDRLYRVGGDEFAAIIRTAAVREVEAVTARLLKAARAVRTTVSIGTAPFDSPDVESTRSRADVALYGAKAAGRDTAQHS